MVHTSHPVQSRQCLRGLAHRRACILSLDKADHTARKRNRIIEIPRQQWVVLSDVSRTVTTIKATTGPREHSTMPISSIGFAQRVVRILNLTVALDGNLHRTMRRRYLACLHILRMPPASIGVRTDRQSLPMDMQLVLARHTLDNRRCITKVRTPTMQLASLCAETLEELATFFRCLCTLVGMGWHRRHLARRMGNRLKSRSKSRCHRRAAR